MRKFILSGIMLVTALGFAVGSVFAQDTEDTAWLGVAIVDQDDQVVIARVQTGSPANAADLLIGDVIVSFDGEAVTSASDLSDKVKAAAPGDTVTLELLRNGESVSVEVTLGSTPTRFGRGRGAMPDDVLSAAEILLHVDLQEADAGFEVVNVFAGRNPFDLEEGDVITAVNDQAVAELDLETLMADLAAADDPQLTLTITRAGEEMTLEADFFGRHFRPGRGGPRGGFDGQQPGNPADMPESAPSGDL